MDRFVYLTMSSAQQLLEQQAVAAHNLANASTTGYKAETTAFRVAPLVGEGLPTRAYSLETSTGADLSSGPLQATGRDLDVAIQGDGFFSVQATDGTEAYTRDGGFSVNGNGDLTTRSGLIVLGDGGPLNIPQGARVTIAGDGTISAVVAGQTAASSVVGRLKLVNPAKSDIAKGTDGLFRARRGEPLEADAAVSVVAGNLEASNVNAISAMVEMIAITRQFEMHMKLLQNAEGNDQRATQLLSTTSA